MPTLLRLVGLDVTVLEGKRSCGCRKPEALRRYSNGHTCGERGKAHGILDANVLMQYVQNGGTLVMQYNTLQDLSTTKLGPYPFSLSGDRVTEEDAKLTFHRSLQARLLTYPNKITQADFDRLGAGARPCTFLISGTSITTPLVCRCKTRGEQPQKGSTLHCQIWKRKLYIYHLCRSSGSCRPAIKEP
jgi:hypothetical protein